MKPYQADRAEIGELAAKIEEAWDDVASYNAGHADTMRARQITTDALIEAAQINAGYVEFLRDQVVALWHESGDDVVSTLAEALGMDNEEYARWVEGKCR